MCVYVSEMRRTYTLCVVNLNVAARSVVCACASAIFFFTDFDCWFLLFYFEFPLRTRLAFTLRERLICFI